MQYYFLIMFPNTKSFQLPQLNTQETKKIGKNKKDKKRGEKRHWWNKMRSFLKQLFEFIVDFVRQSS